MCRVSALSAKTDTFVAAFYGFLQQYSYYWCNWPTSEAPQIILPYISIQFHTGQYRELRDNAKPLQSQGIAGVSVCTESYGTVWNCMNFTEYCKGTRQSVAIFTKNAVPMGR